jgi:hypothetical protein
MPLKLAVFNVQKYVKEEDFAVEFMMRDGVRMLIDLMDGVMPPNTLAVSDSGIKLMTVCPARRSRSVRV